MAETRQTLDSKNKPDYSELPQKPITLKKDIGGLVVPEGEKEQSEGGKDTSAQDAMQNKQVSVKKRSTASGQWTVRGISKSAREIATNAARKEGLKLHEWLERAIYQSISSSTDQQTSDQSMLDALQDIRNRLERIEAQSGFLYRIWRRVKLWFA